MAGRIHSIDAMRIVAMVFVVVVHTDPFRGLGATGNAANFALETTARFAVPFFFVTSGYLFARKTTGRDPIDYLTTQAASLTSLYVFGLLVTAPVFLGETVGRAALEGEDVLASATTDLVAFTDPLALLYYGNSVSEILWFLPALLFSLAFVAVGRKLGGAAVLVAISLGLHVVGLLGTSYTMFVDVPFEIRDALFFGFFYTSLGYAIHASDWEPRADRSELYLGATLLFAAAQLGEQYVLGYVLTAETVAESVYTPSFTIATIALSIALFAFLLSRPELGRGTPVPSWGKYAVGIYVTHPAVLFVLERTGDELTASGYAVRETLLWHLALTPATFFGALGVYLAAYRLDLVAMDGPRLPGLRRLQRPHSE